MVHQYQLNGYNIVLDTCSGAIHAVDEVAYDIIALYPDHTADEIVSAMMEKYGEREDVTEQELRDCIADVDALKAAVIDGETVERCALSNYEGGTYESRGYTLTVAVENGAVRVSESDCPNQDCVHSGAISRAGQSIVCLPARVAVTLEGAASDYDLIAG